MRRRLALVLLSLALVGSACGGNGDEPEAQSSEPPSQLTGVIVDVDAKTLTEVKGFTLRSEGETYEILLAPEANLGFPPSHLNEHSISGDPVTVDLVTRDGRLYALSVADA